MEFKDYIRKVLPKQADRDRLRHFCAAVLQRRKPEKGLCLVGSGMNGKSTIIQLLDDASYDIEKKDNVIVRGKMPEHDAAGMMGRLAGVALFAMKVSDLASTSVAFLKSIMGGDPMPARRAFGKNTMHRATFKGGVILECNTLPSIFEEQKAWSRRFDILHPVRVDEFRNMNLTGPEMVESFKDWVF